MITVSAMAAASACWLRTSAAGGGIAAENESVRRRGRGGWCEGSAEGSETDLGEKGERRRWKQ